MMSEPSTQSLVAQRMPTLGRAGALLAAMLVVLAMASTGCGKGRGAIPETAQGRIEQMAGVLPSNTEALVVAGDLGNMSKTLASAQESFGGIYPIVYVAQKQLEHELGVNVLDGASWKKAGLATPGGFTLAVTDNRPVLVAYVEDRALFDKAFSEGMKKAYSLEGTIKSQEVGDLSVKVMGTDAKNQVAWAYDGKMVLAALPAMSDDAPNTPSVTNLLARISATKAESSLAKGAPFQKFVQALAKDHGLAAFVNSKDALTDQQLANVNKDMGAEAGMVLDWARKNGDAFGLGLGAKDNRISLRTFMAADAKLVATALEAKKSFAVADWSSFGTEKTMIGARMSLDFAKVWELYLGSLPEEQRRALRRELQRTGENFGLDIEKDVLGRLSGNAALFFYGVDVLKLLGLGGAEDILGQLPVIAQAAGLMVAVEFKSAEELEKLTAQLVEIGQGLVASRPLVNGAGEEVKDVRVLELRNMQESPGAIYVRGKLLIFATSAFSENSVHQYLSGTRQDKKLGDVAALDLGKRALGKDAFNGLYINGVRANDNIGSVVPIPMVRKLMGQIEEISLEGDVTEHGLIGALHLDLTPKAKGTAEREEAPAKPAPPAAP